MPDLQPYTSSGNKTYKDFILDTSIKSKLDPEYGLRIAQDIEQKYSAGVANGYMWLRNQRFKENLLWASGKINIYSRFGDLVGLNAKINYANINWKAIMIVNRIMSGLIGRWMDRREKIQVTAIDPISTEAKKEQYEQAEFILYNKQQLEQLEKESGVPMIPPDQFVAEDKDDLEAWSVLGNRLPEEILYELGTNNILESQGYLDALKEKLLWDSSTYGLVGTYTWMDEYGVIHVEWIDPLNAFYSYSKFEDFRDNVLRGFVKSLKISELRRKYGKQFGGKLTEEEIFKIAQQSKEFQRFDKLAWNYEWNLSYIRPYDEWNVEVIYFWIKSVDEQTALSKVTQQHNSTITKTDVQRPENLGENEEFINKDYWNIYKGVYIRESVKILEWGLDNNMIRSQDPTESGDVEFPISFYMYQNTDMRNIALPEKIEEPVEGMILARLKIQQLIATMTPAGAAINWDAMQELDLGLASDNETAIDPQKLYEQTGKLYYRGRDAEGNPIPVPIQELQNSGFIAQMQGLMQNYQFNYGVLKDELGEDPNLISQAIQPRVTSENVQTSQQAAAYATDYMYNAYVNVMKQTAKKVACLLNNSVRFGASAYRHIMKEEDVENRNFSTLFRLLPDQLEIQDMVMQLNEAIRANPQLIQYLDPFKLKRIAKEDVKLAEVYMRNAMKKMIRMEAQKAQQQSEQNAQVQAQAAQMKAQGEMQLFQAQSQMKALEIGEQSKAKKEEIVLAGYFELVKNGIQLPPEFRQIVNQLVPNISIPLGMQNKQMVQGIVEQSESQEQEMEQPSMEEQQQQQMQMQ
jgi:hypothetical protein